MGGMRSGQEMRHEARESCRRWPTSDREDVCGLLRQRRRAEMGGGGVVEEVEVVNANVEVPSG